MAVTNLAQRSETSGVSGFADRAFTGLRLDRIAGGRSWSHRVAESDRTSDAVCSAFRRVRVLLGIETAVGVAALVLAVVLASRGVSVPLAVWIRATAVLLITLSLFVFAWRAQLGWWWAYSRLSLFSVVFPAVTIVLALIPGLYPAWMIIEQVIFAGLMLGVAVLLRSAAMRATYRKPSR
jgi:hypothetical protein